VDSGAFWGTLFFWVVIFALSFLNSPLPLGQMEHILAEWIFKTLSGSETISIHMIFF